VWPFTKTGAVGRLGAVLPGEPGAVELVATVVSPDATTSPLTGARCVFAYVELLEHLGTDPQRIGSVEEEVALGAMVYGGDPFVLRDEHGDEVSLVARRVRVELASALHTRTPLEQVPAELIPFLRRASGRGAVCYRERALREGDKVRLEAVVEGHRSGTRVSYVVRDDLRPTYLKELFVAQD
jgi:hypothetical protein